MSPERPSFLAYLAGAWWPGALLRASAGTENEGQEQYFQVRIAFLGLSHSAAILDPARTLSSGGQCAHEVPLHGNGVRNGAGDHGLRVDGPGLSGLSTKGDLLEAQLPRPPKVNLPAGLPCESVRELRGTRVRDSHACTPGTDASLRGTARHAAGAQRQPSGPPDPAPQLWLL